MNTIKNYEAIQSSLPWRLSKFSKIVYIPFDILIAFKCFVHNFDHQALKLETKKVLTQLYSY